MQCMLLIYNDDALLSALPPDEVDAIIRDCFTQGEW